MPLDIDLAFKVMAFSVMSLDKKNILQPYWQSFANNYIIPMLKNMISFNVYVCIADILNNLFISSYN